MNVLTIVLLHILIPLMTTLVEYPLMFDTDIQGFQRIHSNHHVYLVLSELTDNCYSRILRTFATISHAPWRMNPNYLDYYLLLFTTNSRPVVSLVKSLYLYTYFPQLGL